MIPKFWCSKKCSVTKIITWPELWCNICTLHLSPQALPFSKLRPSQQVVASILVQFAGKTLNTKICGGTPPHRDCKHPVDVSHMSCGDVPSVPWTFCPICVDSHTNQVRTSRMSLARSDRPRTQIVPGHFRGIPTSKFLHVFCLSFLSP